MIYSPYRGLFFICFSGEQPIWFVLRAVKLFLFFKPHIFTSAGKKKQALFLSPWIYTNTYRINGREQHPLAIFNLLLSPDNEMQIPSNRYLFTLLPAI